MRRLHRDHQRRCSPLVPDAGRRRRRQIHHDDRGPGAKRHSAPGPVRIHRSRRIPVRVLHLRNDHEHRRAAREKSESERRRDCRRASRKYLPLWSASELSTPSELPRRKQETERRSETVVPTLRATAIAQRMSQRFTRRMQFTRAARRRCVVSARASQLQSKPSATNSAPRRSIASILRVATSSKC